ncbi:hypothetical protein GWI33_006080 [Rhynchophorus ferrugineus]|uniref:Uncharacterized protein n=1 Tax=Rhynchophorus ferrugineus TaxID=354439 RepID=A0A834IID1_RHYFE|nr:hypothetical protein GWI33_006080 [Rhynchophorus ferrugineus]
MDNPGISLFQGTDININNSQNNEEEEDLEDQIRRKEELQNLLQANLDDFKYDDSTINSSTNISMVSVDNIEQNYKNAITPSEQLKVLYDVRVREIQALHDEYNQYKETAKRDIDSLKHKNILFEQELRQAQISLKNSESLLVDKTQVINTLTSNLAGKDDELKSLKDIIKANEAELMTYKSELTELHLKFQAHNGPFNLTAKYNSEEYQKSLQEKISKLEELLEDERQKREHYVKEKDVLQEEIQRLVVEKVDFEKENEALISTFDAAQSQCRDLIDVVETLRKENDHLRERMKQQNSFKTENADGTDHNLTDHSSLINHNERLKKMLLDKSVEIDSLKSELKFYVQDIKELLEYRQLKCDIYKKEFEKCNNVSHTKDLLILQNDLQNYRRIIDDKNQQILTLNSNNKDLKEKIEEMLLQTRNEIQNISSKYSVPKLEIMSKELEKAEDTVKILSEKLEESEKRRLSIMKKMQNKIDQNDAEVVGELEKCRHELREVKALLVKERDQNAVLFDELQFSKNEVLSLRNQVDKMRLAQKKSDSPRKSPNKNERDSEDQGTKKEYEQLKDQIKQVMQHLVKNNTSSGREPPLIVKEIKEQMDTFLINIEGASIEKGILEEKFCSWKKLFDDVILKDPDEVLKSQYQQALIGLHSSNEKLKELEKTILGLKSAVDAGEDDKRILNTDLENYRMKLEKAEHVCQQLVKEINNLKHNQHSTDEIKKQLEETTVQLNLKDNELRSKLEQLTKIEEDRRELCKKLDKEKSDVDKLRIENSQLVDELKQAKEQLAKRNLIKEFDVASRSSDSDKENAVLKQVLNYKNNLDEELLKAKELKLRDEIQIEYQKRLSDVEKTYKNMCKDIKDVSKQYEDKLEQQEKQYREYLKMVLKECEKCTKESEEEKIELTNQLKWLRQDFDNYKSSVISNEERYLKIMKNMERESEKSIEAWKTWSRKVVSSCLDIEATNKKIRDKVLYNLQVHDQEVAAIQKGFDAKIEKKQQKDKRNS